MGSTMFRDNPDLYPTTGRMACKMASKINGRPNKILEPEAGKGDLVDAVLNKFHHHRPDISVIESDESLQAILSQKKGCRLIDTDFLSYSGPDKFDLIIANPPFSNGDQHLLKMIDILYSGQIICLLNAETIRNPYSTTRKDLARKLKELSAEIEFIPQAFVDAERKTGVEVALINIQVKRDVETDLFEGADDLSGEFRQDAEEGGRELSAGLSVDEMVAEFNQIVELCTETIISYYRNAHKVGKYIKLKNMCEEGIDFESVTEAMCKQVNQMLIDVRKDFWRKSLSLKEVKARLTEKRRMEFEEKMNATCNLDFTKNNIRMFVLNLIEGYEDTLTEAVVEIFDKMTIRHCMDDGERSENIHYFNGWRTNKAFKVGKKVILPIYASYGSPFVGWSGWKLDYQAERTLNDIDIVMNYFDGMRKHVTISEALREAFKDGENTCESSYFRIKVHKKGTIHLNFLSEDILRRFNVTACKGKGWLPEGYGSTKVEKLTADERSVMESFEGVDSYSKNVGLPMYQHNNGQSLLPLLE